MAPRDVRDLGIGLQLPLGVDNTHQKSHWLQNNIWAAPAPMVGLRYGKCMRGLHLCHAPSPVTVGQKGKCSFASPTPTKIPVSRQIPLTSTFSLRNGHDLRGRRGAGPGPSKHRLKPPGQQCKVKRSEHCDACSPSPATIISTPTSTSLDLFRPLSESKRQ